MIYTDSKKFVVFMMLSFSFVFLTFTGSAAYATHFFSGTECPNDLDTKYSEIDETCRRVALCPDGSLSETDGCNKNTLKCPENYTMKVSYELTIGDGSVMTIQTFKICEPRDYCNDGNMNIFGQCEMKPLCPKGTNLNIFGKCEVPVTKECPEDTKLNVFGDCQATPSCDKGTLNVFGDCEVKPSCPSGSTSVLGMCQKKAECEKKTLGVCTDYSCDQGWKQSVAICSKAPSCPSGMSMKDTVCVSSPDCPAGTSLNDIDVCVGAVEESCPYSNSANDLGFCIYDPTCWVGWSYNEDSHLCIDSATTPTENPSICSEGYLYNSYSGKCYAIPECSFTDVGPWENYFGGDREFFSPVFRERMDECSLNLCKNSERNPNWIESSECDKPRHSYTPYGISAELVDSQSLQISWNLPEDPDSAEGYQIILTSESEEIKFPQYDAKDTISVYDPSNGNRIFLIDNQISSVIIRPFDSQENYNIKVEGVRGCRVYNSVNDSYQNGLCYSSSETFEFNSDQHASGFSQEPSQAIQTKKGFLLKGVDEISSEKLLDLYENDESFRNWISENSQETQIEKNIKQAVESYEQKNNDNLSKVDETPIAELEKKIPEWIKEQGKWWINGSISDNEAIHSFEYLIKNGIIEIPDIPQPEATGKPPVPSWFKNNVRWWTTGQVSDFEFAKSLEHLIKIGVIVIHN